MAQGATLNSPGINQLDAPAPSMWVTSSPTASSHSHFFITGAKS